VVVFLDELPSGYNSSSPSLCFTLPQHNVEEFVGIEVHSLVFLLQRAQSSGGEDGIVGEQTTFFDSFHRPTAQPRIFLLKEFAEALQPLDDDEGLLHRVLVFL